MGKLTFFLLILLIWLQYSLWFGKNGFLDYKHVSSNIIKQQEENIKLKRRNDQIYTEINNFNRDYEMIEEYARNELNMIKPEETFYRLVPNTIGTNLKINTETIDK